MKKLVILLTLIGILSSCSPQLKGDSLFSGQLCGDLCWNDIVVGQTNEQELLEIISKLPNVKQESLTSYDVQGGGIFERSISFQYYRSPIYNDSLVNVTTELKNGIVVSMIFQGDLGLQFKDFINAFGEPNYASSLWESDGGINVNIIYRDKGMELTTYFKSEKSSVYPETDINYFFFFDPAMYDTFLESDILTPDFESFILYPWAGFGKIEDHYWPPR